MKLKIKSNHKKHTKKVCYVRDQANGKNEWKAVAVYWCSCGVALKIKEVEL